VTDAAALFAELQGRFAAAVLSSKGEGDDTVIEVKPEILHEALAYLKGEKGFNVLVDLFGVDHSNEMPRFEVHYKLMSLDADTGLVSGRVAVLTRVAEGEAVPLSAMDLWPAADWLEREVWDMFGVTFADRPGIKRILMYDGFVGHPLRKDYPIRASHRPRQRRAARQPQLQR
jgi:NADH-quinone oxidoreductase subunit C